MIVCKNCGKIDSDNFTGDVGDRMRENQYCFSCAFWYIWANRSNDPRVVIINNHHYYIGDEDYKSGFRGFGGAKFIIEFFDGRKVTSTNLWSQGDIDAFCNLMPDNARFAKE